MYYTLILYCIYALVGGAISIRDPYICAIHESVPTNHNNCEYSTSHKKKRKVIFQKNDQFYAKLKTCTLLYIRNNIYKNMIYIYIYIYIINLISVTNTVCFHNNYNIQKCQF